MNEVLYRVWDKTNQKYMRAAKSNHKFFLSEAAAKGFITRCKDGWWYKGEEYEIHEFIAVPKSLWTIDQNTLNELHYVMNNDPQSEYSEIILQLIKFYEKTHD